MFCSKISENSLPRILSIGQYFVSLHHQMKLKPMKRIHRMLFISLFACLAVCCIYAQTDVRSVMHLTLKDGTVYHFLLSDQRPTLKSHYSRLVVTYQCADGSGQAPQLTFERDVVQSLTFGNYDPTAVALPKSESTIRFNLTAPGEVRVSGLQPGDCLEAYGADGKQVAAARRAASGELSLNLSHQPRGVYIISVNRRQTFKFLKP